MKDNRDLPYSDDMIDFSRDGIDCKISKKLIDDLKEHHDMDAIKIINDMIDKMKEK